MAAEPSDPAALPANSTNLGTELRRCSSDIDTINSMSPQDALAISQELHRQLQFDVTDSSEPRIDPHPHEDDIRDACQRRAVDLSASQEACRYYEKQQTEDGFSDPFPRPMSLIEARQIAAALNELYGVR